MSSRAKGNTKQTRNAADILRKLEPAQVESEEDKKGKNNILKRLPIVWIITALIVISWAGVIWYDSQPFDGMKHMRNYVFADASYLDGAELISAKRDSDIIDFDIHIALKLQIDQAARMVKNNVLKECVDRSIHYGDHGSYICSDPVWEPMENEFLYTGTTIPDRYAGSLCTKSWPDIPEINNATHDGTNSESKTVLCVNPKTGELSYSYYNY